MIQVIVVVGMVVLGVMTRVVVVVVGFVADTVVAVGLTL